MKYEDVITNLEYEIGYYKDDVEMGGELHYLEFKQTVLSEFARIENVIRDLLAEGFEIELALSIQPCGSMNPVGDLRVKVNNDMLGVFFDFLMDGNYRYFTVYSKADTGNPIDSPVSGAELFGLIKRYLRFDPMKALDELSPLSILGNTRSLFGMLK